MTQSCPDLPPSRSGVKTAPQKPPSATGSRLGWQQVSRALDADETLRALVLRLYREGFRGCVSGWVSPPPEAPRVWTPDDFGHRAEARRCLADCITAAEDVLDAERRTARRDTLALALRDIRRRLEVELYQ